MWKMFNDMIECDECDGILEPPPNFMIPPPPRPPSMGDKYSLSNDNCNEAEMAQKAQQAWDMDMCEAVPIQDASLYSSQSLQTSAIIAVFSLLLILIVLISSLFMWKNKRKVQNFLPCKTPTRGPHINGTLPMNSIHSAAYEDSNAHLGHHRPLVMRDHHNVDVIHSGKSVHFPSGYPMTRSPPFLVSSSPGPDPYRSHDNVYEELGSIRDSDGDSEPPIHSDDDFAEDELSLPGQRSFNKSNVSDCTAILPAFSTIYHERVPPIANLIRNERSRIPSTSAYTQEASTTTVISSNSSHNYNTSASVGVSCSALQNNFKLKKSASRSNLLSGILLTKSNENKFYNSTTAPRPGQNSTYAEQLYSSASTANSVDNTPIQQMYDDHSHFISLTYQPQITAENLSQPTNNQHHSLHRINNNRLPPRLLSTTAPVHLQFHNSLQNEVDQRNHITTELGQPEIISAGSTIYRELIKNSVGGRYPQLNHTSPNGGHLPESGTRTRLFSSSIDRRNRVVIPHNVLEPTYSYAEPLFRETFPYKGCMTPPLHQQLAYPSYVMQNYANTNMYITQPDIYHWQRANAASSQIYAHCGDSSFGSDSGYSQNTPASSIGRNDYEATVPIAAPPTPNQKGASKLSNALNFGWHRRKATSSNCHPTSLFVKPTTPALSTYSATTSTSSYEGNEATSPNHNSASSTITSTIDATSSESASSVSNQNNKVNNNTTVLIAHG